MWKMHIRYVKKVIPLKFNEDQNITNSRIKTKIKISSY